MNKEFRKRKNFKIERVKSVYDKITGTRENVSSLTTVRVCPYTLDKTRNDVRFSPYLRVALACNTNMVDRTRHRRYESSCYPQRCYRSYKTDLRLAIIFYLCKVSDTIRGQCSPFKYRKM